MNVKSWLLGFLAGGIATGIATLLSAPASGVETRRKLAENKEAFTAELNDLKLSLVEIKESVSAASKEGKTVINDFVQDVKLAVDEWQLSTDENKVGLEKELKEIEQTIQDLEKELTTELQQ